MNKEYKKAVFSFLYRLAICIILFGIAFSLSRFFPSKWDYIHGLFRHNADFTRAGKCLKEFFTEILPLGG